VGNVVLKVARVRLPHIKAIGLVPCYSIFYDPTGGEHDVFSLNQILQTKCNSRIYVPMLQINPFTATALRYK